MAAECLQQLARGGMTEYDDDAIAGVSYLVVRLEEAMQLLRRIAKVKVD